MTRTNTSKLSPPLLLAGFAAVFGVTTGCKKEEPPPPLPSAAAPVDTAPLELKPIDAGIAPEDSGTEKKKTGSGRGSAGGLMACCQALEQNSHSQPTEQMKNNLLQAAAMCKAAAKAGSGSLPGMVRGLLAGAGMPAACK